MTAHRFTLTWTLPATPAEVFAAWTEPDQLGWFYNDAYPEPDEPIEVDLRVGGEWRQRMIVDDDTTYVTGGLYREIVPGEKLVFTWGATGGWPTLDPTRPDDCPLVTVVFDGAEQGTHLTVHVELPAAFANADLPAGWLDHVEPGMRETVDRLADRFTATRR